MTDRIKCLRRATKVAGYHGNILTAHRAAIAWSVLRCQASKSFRRESSFARCAPAPKFTMNSCQLVIPHAAGAGSFSLWWRSCATIDVHGRWRPASEEEELLGRPDSSGLVASTVLLLVEVLGRPAFQPSSGFAWQ
jgi:hypothetical protein